MPQFKYQLTNGKSLTLEGDAMPSDDEVEKAAKNQGVELVPHNQDQNVKQNEPTTPAPESKAPEKDNEKPSLFSSLYKKAVTPLTDYLPDSINPAKVSDRVAESFQHPNLNDSGLTARLKGFAGGAMSGLGREISGLTSPLNITLAAASGGASAAERMGADTAASGLRRIAQAASIPIVGQGISDVINKPDIAGKLGGGINAVLGVAGFASGFESPKLGDIAESAREPVGTGTPLNVELPKEVTQQDRPSGPWEGNTSTAAKPKSPEDLAYDVAREKFNMGRDLPDDKGKSEVRIPELVSEGAPPIRQKTGNFFIDDSNRMKDEALSRRADPVRAAEDKAKSDSWNQTQDNLRIHDGLFGKSNTKPLSDAELTPEQLAIRNSYREIQAHSNAHAEHFSEMENQLPENEYYEEPPEEKARYEYEQNQLRDRHEQLINNYKANRPTAEFLGMQPDGKGGADPLFNVKGGPSDGSTVGADTLQKMGIEVPEVPKDAANLNGDQLRQIALNKKSGLSVPDDIFSRQGKNSAPSFGSNQGKAADIFPTDKAPQEVTADRQANPSKPRYRLDNESGGLVPIDKDGQQTGPVIFPGKELDPALATESKYNKPPGGGNGNKPPDKSSLLQKIYDTPRGLMSVDLPYMTSAAFRQASPYVGTSDWFKSWVPAAKSFGSKEAYDAINAEINNRPLFQPRSGNTPSIAEQAGLNLTDLGKYSKREEALRGELAEKVPYYGKYVAASNRAYTAFLNSLRANRFEDLVGNLEKDDISTPENRSQVANAINTLTGRGKLAIHPNAAQGSFTNVEAASKVLSNVFFSPRKIASEVQMLNPATYIMTNPVARKELLSGALRRVATWWSIAGLAELSGATVSKDPTNPDFGKIKVGDTRIDPPGGLQQYLVLGSQIAAGGKTSSTSGKFTKFGSKFGADTAFDAASNFATNRFHPTAKYIVDLAKAKKSSPFFPADQAAQLALPMYTQDIAQIAQNNPNLIPMLLGAPLSGAGIGVQTYDKNSFKKPTFIPHNYDLQIPSAGR